MSLAIAMAPSLFVSLTVDVRVRVCSTVMPQAKQLCQDEAFELLECLPWKASGLGENELG